MTQQAKAKLILQQCTSARLQVAPATEEAAAEFVEIGRGVVAYVCFLKDANQETVDKLCNVITAVKLSRNDSGKLVSVTNIEGDILVVPQATLGGKLKGKSMQYHNNIDKSRGSELYQSLINVLSDAVSSLKSFVRNGTYGNLQVLKVDTNGPYTHVVDIF